MQLSFYIHIQKSRSWVSVNIYTNFGSLIIFNRCPKLSSATFALLAAPFFT